MKKLFKLIFVVLAIILDVKLTYSYFSSSYDNESKFKTKKYNFVLNGNGGTYADLDKVIVKNNKVVLPQPTREGYTFVNYGVDNNIDNINNKELYANWSINIYNINYNLNGGYLSDKIENYTIEDAFNLGIPQKVGSNFVGWTGSNGDIPENDVYISNGTIGNLKYIANWDTQKFTIDVNSVIQNNLYSSGLEGFTFSIWLNDNLVADHVIKYYNSEIEYGTQLKICVYDREGYSIRSFKEKTYTVQSDLNIRPEWYDDIPPTITSFSVTNLGYYDLKYGDIKGWNIRVYINGYDNGTGIYKYQTWLKPYGSGSGAVRKDGNDRILKNVLYLKDVSGRTFCAYAIDNAGNESEMCETIKV